MSIIRWSSFLLALLGLGGANAASVYAYSGNPFQPGPLPVSNLTLNKDDGIPYHTEVFFPTTPGTYAPVLFAPGVFTSIVTELYSTVLAHFSSYGYIVAGVDLFWPVTPAEWERPHKWRREFGPEEHEYEKMFDVMNWLVGNLNQNVLPRHGAPNVYADWGDLGIMSHSLGADLLVQMLQSNKTFAKAAAFLEPASLHFSKPLGFSIPAMAYGTQLCSESPACCEKDFGYFHFYDELVCPRILMNVTGYGHCDIVNEDGWKLCRDLHFCKTDPSNNRDIYRKEFVPGVLASFFGDYLQGNAGIVKYITTRDLMPIPSGQLYVDIINCTTVP